MKREELLRSREYWLTHIQNDIYNLIENYRKKKNLNQTQLGVELGVSKGYISQMLNGDFDHKVSKLVDLALAFNKVPIISYLDLEKYIKDDKDDNIHFLEKVHHKPIEFNTVFYITPNIDFNNSYFEDSNLLETQYAFEEPNI